MVAINLENYNHRLVENKWQTYWESNKTFQFDPKDLKHKYYVLSMFLYPSGEMHVGHLRNFAIGDVIARYKRLQGFNVLHPTGADAFGLPAENAAIKNNIHPSEWTHKNFERILGKMTSAGLSFDTSKTFLTCDPEYYGWQQKLFIEFFKRGLAYQKESFVNWDPVDNTVLANEQVVDGRGWRSGAIVEKKKLNQWFFRITRYAEELLDGIDKLYGWSDKVKLMQENWIGKSEGALVDFKFCDGSKKIRVYTTRPDTLFGAAFIGISPNHPLAEELAKKDLRIANFIDECNKTAVNEETIEKMEKKGIDTGLFVKHPFDNDIELPVFIANFILMDYGTGAIFGCPAHDKRDFEFAKKYKLPILTVVSPNGKEYEVKDEPFTEEGIAINSGFMNGSRTEDAKKEAIERIEELKIGERKINYRLRDWGISRQRYWGCPIPIIHCPHCGAVAVPDKDLPVMLPKDVVFDGKGNPLANHPIWKHTKCPKCGADAERETDTMDTFVDSSWYFLRLIDPTLNAPFSSMLCNEAMPIDQYVGGIEHATMHLIYFRFFVKALRDCGFLNIDEPTYKLFNQGMVCHKAYRNSKKEWIYPWNVKEENGKYFDINSNEELTCEGIIKMSKSKCNVVDITNILETYGADAARMFVLSDSPADKDFEWTETGIEGCWKYINRIWKMVFSFVKENRLGFEDYKKVKINESNQLYRNCHKTIKDVTIFLENLEFNKAIARIREFTNELEKVFANKSESNEVLYYCLSVVVKLLAPFTPHFSEELNYLLGWSLKLNKARWPEYKNELTIDKTITIAIQINGKLRGTIEVDKDISDENLKKIVLIEDSIKKYLIDKDIKKIIVVKGKLVSIVVA